MRSISKSNFIKADPEFIKKNLPMVITFNGEPIYIVGSPDKTICMDDMHPNVVRMLKAREAIVRKGMPQAAHIYDKELDESLKES